MESKKQIHGEDIDISKLVPLNTREINFKRNRGYQKILSTIKMIGLIEPLDVYKEKNQYIILNGFLRFKALQELEINPVPCLIHPNKEAYTFNKMINNLSPVQESRMLQQARKTLDRKSGVPGMYCHLFLCYILVFVSVTHFVAHNEIFVECILFLDPCCEFLNPFIVQQ